MPVTYGSAAEKGFQLVELFILVIILALLVAVAGTQFRSTPEEVKNSMLDTTLLRVRSAINLYFQHHGAYPGKLTADSPACAATTGTGTGGVGAQGAQAFLDQLSMFTDADGGACSVRDSNFEYGPYLKNPTLPKNPITSVAALEVINKGEVLIPGTGASLGWKYDIVVGRFIANDTTDPDGVGPEISYDQR